MRTTTYVSGSRRIQGRQRGTDLVAKWVYAVFGLQHRPRGSADRLSERMRRDIGITRFSYHASRRAD
jgi:hypothetical protein